MRALALLCWTQGALAGTVLVVGDSISAAFGLETSQGWVHLLQERLVEGDESWRVVNASISGDTTAGGLARLDPLLEAHTLRWSFWSWAAMTDCVGSRLCS